MCRPKHLDCVNTPEGIRRINEEQSYYDKDPEEYERREEEIQQALWDEECQRREEERQQALWDEECQRREEIQQALWDEECQRRDWERMVYEENQDL